MKSIRLEKVAKQVKDQRIQSYLDEGTVAIEILCYTGTKFGTKFTNIKDLVKKYHQYDVVFCVKCPLPSCVEDYNGETGRILHWRVTEYNGRRKKSYLYKHSQEGNHPFVTLDKFEIRSVKEKLLSYCWLKRNDHHLTCEKCRFH